MCGENQLEELDALALVGSSPRVRGKRIHRPLWSLRVRLIPACAGKTPKARPPSTQSRAHPRVCGENATAAWSGVQAAGSSPRVRGKRSHDHGPGGPRGLIPACAGKTACALRASRSPPAHPRVCGENERGEEDRGVGLGSSPRVRGKLVAAHRVRAVRGAHPRVCGENDARRSAFDSARGSSPRVRGKLIAQPRPPALPRLIPACAGKTVRVGSTSMTSGAHPRVCGENWSTASRRSTASGSSPRVRGKRRDRRGQFHGLGLIPACAGKTQPAWTSTCPDRAHPRVCGENQCAVRAGMPLPGSSPRVRGKRQIDGVDTDRGRLIPACAGKTGSSVMTRTMMRAHPRVCGENFFSFGGVPGAVGSSPRVRGKPRGDPEQSGNGGLIPACAGKTTGRKRTRRRGAAHPRVCGENRPAAAPPRRSSGSSPRVRGKHGRADERRAGEGLIPACAGKTASSGAPPGSARAHPRVCGENVHDCPFRGCRRGSSPRVRGKHQARRSPPTGARLIPACAGKTFAATRSTRSSSAHPRVCGENGSTPARTRRWSGSSPRVRGKPLHWQHLGVRPRLIPACAGKTRRRRGRSCGPPAHPRVCGENAFFEGGPVLAGGSSPRVRGKPRPGRGYPHPVRLIPACAGKTGPARAGCSPARAHPRVCGENAAISWAASWSGGSSPRVRGKRCRRRRAPVRRRLIPACAGKTSGACLDGGLERAHPRVCGENTS